ncbi:MULTISPECIES: hypothetical protein [Photorhabdus]|uniref:hypothetical protein n=1 Tax=Photorhabdus TaxID=29487 RepID=UPI0011B0F008|nr:MULTISPECIES: hypothetical protein [Photorhabdus]MCC8459141.1 hypothetical protein [Photorhabdus aegyptia]
MSHVWGEWGNEPLSADCKWPTATLVVGCIRVFFLSFQYVFSSMLSVVCKQVGYVGQAYCHSVILSLFSSN